VIVSLEEWRRRRRAFRDEEPGRRTPEILWGLGDEVVFRAWSEAAAGRAVEVHRLAAAVVVGTGDGLSL
jgi:hypothetical protein